MQKRKEIHAPLKAKRTSIHKSLPFKHELKLFPKKRDEDVEALG